MWEIEKLLGQGGGIIKHGWEIIKFLWQRKGPDLFDKGGADVKSAESGNINRGVPNSKRDPKPL